MANARFSIGIDLGTTNSALAFVPIAGDARSEVFAVPQWDSPARVAEAESVPSFLYLPDAALAAQLRAREDGRGAWIVGRLARRQAAEAPGRVAQSAKSWLCHHAVDRTAPFLPWGSEEIAPEDRISPIRASALILNFLRGAWNTRFAGSGPDFAFDAQDITVTVPASFDAAAQRLTLDAARAAGFPDGVRLLEEPQAAFYRWLEQHDSGADLWSRLPEAADGAHHVLVVDIGGGTSDFSLFELRRTDHSPLPAIRRIAVSEHILLGGDNVDLALAHLVEPRFATADGKLSGRQWETLVARCRDLKEKALAADGAEDEAFTVSIPGRGSGLVAGALSARLTRAEIEAVLLDGFFPECAADARPRRTRTALKEWGLPYATDSAVTRHLADFLSERPRVDAVLFNGGTLHPAALRARLCGQIAAWQGGAAPLVLDNPEPHLAVARGAARFGKILRLRAERIEAGAARAVFIEAHRRPPGAGEAKAAPKLVCILPRGAAPDETFEVADVALELRLNRPVRFRAHSSTRQGRSRAGDVLDWNETDFHPLPPLETVARLEAGEGAGGEPGRTVPVTLAARLNELGLLQIECRSADPAIDRSWPLAFNLRPHEPGTPGTAAPAPLQAEPNAEPAAVEAAKERMAAAFSRPLGKREKLSATRLFKSLESILGVAKGDWNWVLVRALWPALEAHLADRARSVEHEETWLILAGFLLRPGFGAPLDEARIDGLWRLREVGLCFPGKRIRPQEHILWRRVAGGLSRERQERILAPELGRLRQQANLAPELIRMAGAFERLGPELKIELARRFLETAAALARAGKHCAPHLAALGLLLNRTPLYAGPETVLPPDLVETAFEAFAGLDWTHPELQELQTLFLRAARVTGNRTLDLPKALRSRIAGKLEKSGVPPLKTARIRDYMPLERAERTSLYGEALPPGLILAGD